MENFDAHDAIRYATERRNALAAEMRSLRNRLAEHVPPTLRRRYVNQSVRASARAAMRPRHIPPAVTVPALRRQLENLTWAASAPMPDFTQDDGYSMCGAEDGWADAVDSARQQAHETLAMLIYQMSREREARW